MTALAAIQAPASERESSFASVVCVSDDTSSGHAARRQAAALATGGAVTHVRASGREWADPQVVLDLEAGADLLVLGAESAPKSVLLHASIPVLVSRWPAGGADITERMLVVVDNSVAPEPAAELAGELAALHGGSAIVFPSVEPDPRLGRAVSATRRIVSRSTGEWPRLHGSSRARNTEIVHAVRELDASMLVFPMGDSWQERATAVELARLVGCPMLCVPSTTLSGARDF